MELEARINVLSFRLYFPCAERRYINFISPLFLLTLRSTRTVSREYRCCDRGEVGWLVDWLVSVVSVCAKPWIDSRPPRIIGVNWRKARGSRFKVCPPRFFLFPPFFIQRDKNVNSSRFVKIVS